MEDKILKLLGRKNYLPSNIPELLKGLKLPPNEQQNLQRSLRELERLGKVARIKGNRYILPREADLIPGRIQITRKGRGFLLPDEVGRSEIAIPESGTGTAMNDDRVLVRLDVRPKGKRSKSEKTNTGTVVRVLERRRTQIVGTLKKGRQFLYVIPDDPRLNHDIYVPPAKDVGRSARPGDKVVVELKEWESRHTNPEGIITEVLGPPTAEGVDMLAVLRNYNLPLKFPRKVLQEARRIGSKVSEKDIAGRVDCRDHSVINIDPADAKDYDDAFFLEPAKGNRWKLWVHIADVSHYVKPGSALDQEAKKRGNSTYLVDRVIPMLPEALSNELCSLKPNVDRLTKCVEFLLSDDGKVIRTRFHEAVIHSRRRFSYEQALEVLNRKAKDPIEEMVQDAGRLAQKIRKRRFAAGSLDLDFPETKIRLDDSGKVKAIEKVDNDESHQLIEEFMLLANEAVAGRLMKLRKPSIHRVHESPEPKRLFDYRQEVLSHNLACGNLEKKEEVQKLLRRLNNLAIGAALKIGFLRSLMRARYSVEPLGHYGLAKQKYAHFTSPIRRYADLIVHRTLFGKGKIPVPVLTRIAEHISTTERNSSDAERDSKDVKLYAYLQAQLKSKSRHQYEALVTDIRNFVLFVDVPDLGMRGGVPLSRLDDDFYEFDTARVQLIGRRTNRTIKLGDILLVEVDKVDAFTKEVDFRPVSKAKSSGRNRRSKKKSSRNTKKRGQRKQTSSRNSRKKKSDPPRSEAPKKRTKRKRPQSRRKRNRKPSSESGS
ncbi:MAG: ribonuclease R [Verrucomicrobiales bacterium]|nr:ribonuclease R [Verrucomicrobiales bacterium]